MKNRQGRPWCAREVRKLPFHYPFHPFTPLIVAGVISSCARPDYAERWPTSFELSAGPQPGYAIKKVVDKQEPALLLADDGSICRGRYLGSMTPHELTGVLHFLRASERLKATHRSAYTSEGKQESVAEHTWRLCLMAMALAPEFPEVDFTKLVKICLVHDLGEAVGGDIPAPEQARRVAAGVATGKGKDERRDLLTLLQPLPPRLGAEMAELWDEYEAAKTPEAKLAKALDKLETIMQHTQGKNPPDFDYGFNLDYGREHTEGPPLIAEIRAILDAETGRLAREAGTSAKL